MNNKCVNLYTLTASLDLNLPMIPTPDARILRARLFRLIASTDQRDWLAEFKIGLIHYSAFSAAKAM